MAGAIPQPITGFEQDDEGHWIAILACGHKQHVRHRPPFTERPWVLTEAGRQSMIGETIDCGLCADGDGAARSQTRQQTAKTRAPK